MTDTLIVFGARCTWWDDISKTANTGPGRSGIPICPHCRGPLFQYDPAEWWDSVARYTAEEHPDYRAMIEWARGKCFKRLDDAKAAFYGDQT